MKTIDNSNQQVMKKDIKELKVFETISVHNKNGRNNHLLPVYNTNCILNKQLRTLNVRIF
jgi:hypothetical protein